MLPLSTNCSMPFISVAVVRPFLNQALKLRDLFSSSYSQLFEGLYIGAQLVALAARDDGVIRGLGGQHAGLDGGMAALDAADVQETCVAAHERAAREHE